MFCALLQRSGAILATVGLICCASTRSILADSAAGDWVEDFNSDPFDDWTFDTGPGDGFGDNSLNQFACDLIRGELIVHYDSTYSTVRLQRPLGREFTEADAFGFKAILRFDSIVAPPTDFMQISFALTNDATTGANRSVPYPDPSNTFDNIELAYYPNESPFFGGPFVTTTVQGSQQDSEDAYSYLSFASTEEELPLETDLTFTGRYDPRTTTLYFTITGTDEVSISTNITEVPSFGNAAEAFTVDQFSITSYFDGADYPQPPDSLDATLAFDAASFFISGDGDDDGDVDLLDYAVLQRCFTGLKESMDDPACEPMDFDGDSDIDLEDYASFRFVQTAPGSEG